MGKVEFDSLINKIARVVAGCETRKQLDTAVTYIELASRKKQDMSGRQRNEFIATANRSVGFSLCMIKVKGPLAIPE